MSGSGRRPAEVAPGGRTYEVRLLLAPVPADLDEVRHEIGDRLDELRPRFGRGATGIELALLVTATDLWLAVLLAMAAVTGAGYGVVRLDAAAAPAS